MKRPFRRLGNEESELELMMHCSEWDEDVYGPTLFKGEN